MSAYLRYFELERSPFESSGQSRVVLGTRALRAAFATIRSGLEEGASRICVEGEAGMGKTSLARAMPKLLGAKARVAVVPDPTISWDAARPMIARQWRLEPGGLARSALLEARREGPLVLVVDQAEKADQDFLDHLDVLLSYRTEADEPAVQSVLMARLTGAARSGVDGAPCPLIWWLDRIQTLQLEFAPLPREGVGPYIEKHLARAGRRGPALFDEEAARAIHDRTGGVPGAISDLCQRLLVEAAERSLDTIDAELVRAICEPTAETTRDDVVEATVGDADDDAAEQVVQAMHGDAVEEVAQAMHGDAVEEVAQAMHGDAVEEVARAMDAAIGDPASLPDDPFTRGTPGSDPEADALLAPPTEAELRALRGHPLARFARPVFGALAASVIGGLLLALGGADPESPSAQKEDRTATRATSASGIEPRSRLGSGAAPGPAAEHDEAPLLFAPAGGFVAVAPGPAHGGPKMAGGESRAAHERAAGEQPALPAAPSPGAMTDR